MAHTNGSLPEGKDGHDPAKQGARKKNGQEARKLKMVMVGESGCGKTLMLLVHARSAFPEQYAPSIFEKYTTSVTVGKKEVLLHLYNTAGQGDYDSLRPLSYQNTNVVSICYDVMNPTSFENILIKWSHEVNHFCRRIPIVLVGCKTDLRKDKEHLHKLCLAQQEPITYSQGEDASCQLDAHIYLECSTKFRENVEPIFQEAASIALDTMKNAKRQTKSKPCAIL